MKKVLLLVLTMVMVVSCMCACGGNGRNGDIEADTPIVDKGPSDEEIKDKIVGAWVAEQDGNKVGFIFNEDGTGIATLLPFTYTVENGVVTMTIEAFGQVEIVSVEYTATDDTLVFEKDGEKVTLQRTEMPE